MFWGGSSNATTQLLEAMHYRGMLRVARREQGIRIYAAHEHGPEPATTFRFADGAPGAIGVIASVTEPFCDTCNRLRLTSDGQLRSCLFSLDEVNLRDPMRAGATDDELAALIRGGVWRKWEGHRINHPDFVRPGRSMSMIGG